jgi:hypothetical protein
MAKKEYIKPEIKKIELKPEEAAITACKTKNSEGPGIQICLGWKGGPACGASPHS